MLEFYQSGEFRKYRKLLLASVVHFVKPMIVSKESYDFWRAQGAMDMARKIVSIPGEQFEGDSGEALRRYAKEDLGEFFNNLIKSQLEG